MPLYSAALVACALSGSACTNLLLRLPCSAQDIVRRIAPGADQALLGARLTELSAERCRVSVQQGTGALRPPP